MSAKAPVPEVKVSLYGMTDVGVVRTNNEDTFLVVELTSSRAGLTPENLNHLVQERGTLLLVSDGMGGAEAGEVASRLVVEQMFEGLRQVPLDDHPEDAVRAAVERANATIWNQAQQNAKQHGMGATLAAAWIRGTDGWITGVGDSRVYLLRAGKMRQITRDQSMVESLVEVGMLDRAAAEQHPQRNVILQAMGARPEVVVAIDRIALRRGDFLLLCSDGLSGKISAEEMRDSILTTPALPDACVRMVQLAKERGGEDNITVLVAEFDGEGLPETTLNERMTRTLQSVSGFNFRAGSGYAPPPPAKPTLTLGSEGNDPEPPPPPVVTDPLDGEPTRSFGGEHPAIPSRPGAPTGIIGSESIPRPPDSGEHKQ